MPPNSSPARSERNGDHEGAMNGGTRVARISSTQTALRVPQVSATASKLAIPQLCQPIEEAKTGNGSSRLLQPTNRRVLAPAESGGNTTRPNGQKDLLPLIHPTTSPRSSGLQQPLPLNRLCPSLLLSPARRPLRVAEGEIIGRGSSEEPRRTETEEDSDPVVSVPPANSQKSSLKQPSAPTFRSKSALRVPQPIRTTPSGDDAPPISHADHFLPSNSQSPSLPVPSSSASPSSSPSASQLPQQHSSLKAPKTVAKPVAPKRSGQVIEKEQKAEKEEEEEDKEMTRLCIFRGAKDKEKKPEETPPPPPADPTTQMPIQPKHQNGTRAKESPAKSEEASKIRKSTPSSKSLLMAPSRRTPSSSATGGRCLRVPQPQQMSASNCSDCSVRSAESGGGKRRSTLMNSSQCSNASSAPGGNRNAAGRRAEAMKKSTTSTPPPSMAASSSSSCGGTTSKLSSSGSKLAGPSGIPASKFRSNILKTKMVVPGKAKADEQEVQTGNSPLMTEKKPVLAVKGVSVPSGGSTPPTALRRKPSLNGGGTSPESQAECPGSPLAEARRNPKMVVGVVSPMMQKPGEEVRVVKEKVPSTTPGQMARPSGVPPPVPPKKSKIVRSIPTTIREDNNGNRPEKGRDREEECPSPSVPPPMLPTKLMSVLREAQASPCPSSSVSSPEEEEINHQHRLGLADQNHQSFRSDQLICLAPLDSTTTSNDSADSVRTTIDRLRPATDDLGGSASNCAIEEKNNGRTTEEVVEEDRGKERDEELRKKPGEEEKDIMEEGKRRRRKNNGEKEEEDEEEQQLVRAMMRVGRGGTKGQHNHHPMSGGGGAGHHRRDQSDYASESELDLRRRQSATSSTMRAQHPGMLCSPVSESPGVSNKLVMALDLMRTAKGEVIRRSRFRESYEDSSSLSSGLSEPFDDDISTDDLTGSSSDYQIGGFGQFSPEKMRQFGPQPPHSDLASFQHQQKQQKSLACAAESAGQLLQKCQSAQRGCAYFGPMDPHRPSTSNGYIAPDRTHFVRNSDGRRSGCGQNQIGQSPRHPNPNFHPNEQLFALQQHNQLQQQHIDPQFRPYHTITGATDWQPYQQFQQQQQHRSHGRRPVEPHRVLSPPHNLMVLSDDGDTLSVAAGDIGTMRPVAGTEKLMGQHQMGHNFQNDSLSLRQHPAYHTHSLDRHAHLRVLSSVPRPSPASGSSPSANQNFANISASRNLPHQRLQLSSLLVSPRHHHSNSSYSTGTFASATNGNVPSLGALSARGDSRIYSNLKFPGVNSPTRLALHQPGSQLSLASSIGSTYSTIEERYEWEIGKLQSELESYRTHVQLLNQKNSGYNCMIQLFDNRLQAIMMALGKLQQKHNVKRDEVERLCNEIEQLRALSITAGVVPNRTANGGGGGGGGAEKDKEGGGGEQSGSGKKGWIRSSFSRAFHKGHKKSKQHPQPAQSSADPNSPPRTTGTSASSSMTSKSTSGTDNPAEMVLLKRELEDRESALTDVQLDALDKAKEIDILRDTVSRLQHENKLLKYNFSLLERRVRSESRASSHISLNTTCCLGGSGMEFDVATLEEALAEAPEQLAPLYDLVASSPSSGDISVNTTTTGSNNSTNGGGNGSGVMQFSKAEIGNPVNRNSIASSTGSSKSRSSHASSSPPSAKVVLCVDLSGRLDSPLPLPLPLPPSCSLSSMSRANCASSSTLSSQASSGFGSVLSGGAKAEREKAQNRRELTVGHLALPLGAGTSWRDLDQQLGILLEEYLHRIDPDLSLGIDSYSSIIGYQIHPTQHSSDLCGPSEIFLIRRRGSVSESATMGDEGECAELSELTPRLTPAEALQPGTLIRMRLKGVAQHSVDSLVLESLFPRHLLEQLLRQLEQHRRLLLFGPTGIGKSNLARLLAKYLLMRMDGGGATTANAGGNKFVDIRFPVGDENDAEIKQKVQQTKELLIGSLRPAAGAAVLVLDNLQWKRLGLVLDAFNAGGNSDPSRGGPCWSPFVICTLNRTCVDQSPVQQLQLHHNFRLYALSYKMDAVNGYLGRYLRRRLAEQDLSSPSPTSSSSGPSSSIPLESILHFLGRSLRAINEFIERAATGGPDVTLGPRILLQSPLDGDAAREWFVQLWNDKLCPYMGKVLSESNSFSSTSSLERPPKRHSAATAALAKDPTDEIYALWPWAEGKDRLKRICR